jgi:four helix bundle protein
VRAAVFYFSKYCRGIWQISLQGEQERFLYYSRGSAYETLDWLLKATRRNLIDMDKSSELKLKMEDFLIKLNAYIKSIGNKN